MQLRMSRTCQTCQIQELDGTQACLVGLYSGLPWQRQAGQDADRTGRQANKRRSYFQRHRRNVKLPRFLFSLLLKQHCIYLTHLLNPKPGHTTGGSGRSARRSGRERSGKIGCQQNYSPKKQKSPPRHRKNIASTSLQKHEHAKSYVNRRRNKISG